MPKTNVSSPSILRRAAEDYPLVVMLALMLDAWRPLPAWGGVPWLWLDVAALAGALGCAWAARPGQPRVSMATALDGNLLALLVIGVLMLMPREGHETAVTWFRVGVPCLAVYYTCITFARRTGRLPSFEPALFVAIAGPSLHALASVTQGLGRLAESSRLVDSAWGATHGELKLLALVLPPAFSRSREPEAGPMWRLVVLVGVLGLVLHAIASGFNLPADAYQRLADPLFFSNLTVSMLVVLTVSRRAMTLASADEAHAGRWRALAVSFGLLGCFAVLGQSTGGAAVRAFAAFASAAVIATSESPRRIVFADAPVARALDRAA